MERVTTGSLIRRSIEVFGSGFSSFTVLSLIFFSPIILLKVAAPELSQIRSMLPSGSTLLLFFGSNLLTPIAAAAVVFGVFQGLRGKQATISQCIAVAARRWLGVAGLAILTWIATTVTFLLCIIPGLVVTCGLFLAGPILIAEKLGPVAAAQRSWDLSDGYKLNLFFITVLLLIFELLLGWGLLRFTDLSALSRGSYGPYHALNDLLGVIVTAFNAVVAAVAYHDIRVFREGLGEDDLVAVFE